MEPDMWPYRPRYCPQCGQSLGDEGEERRER